MGALAASPGPWEEGWVWQLDPQEKWPLHAWLSFWGCLHRVGSGRVVPWQVGWGPHCSREGPGSVSVLSPLPEPRSYVESVVRTAVAGPRVQDPEPKSFSAPAAQAYGHETPLRNGTLGGSFVSPSPLSTSSPILSADRYVGRRDAWGMRIRPGTACVRPLGPASSHPDCWPWETGSSGYTEGASPECPIPWGTWRWMSYNSQAEFNSVIRTALKDEPGAVCPLSSKSGGSNCLVLSASCAPDPLLNALYGYFI